MTYNFDPKVLPLRDQLQSFFLALIVYNMHDIDILLSLINCCCLNHVGHSDIKQVAIVVCSTFLFGTLSFFFPSPPSILFLVIVIHMQLYYSPYEPVLYFEEAHITVFYC